MIGWNVEFKIYFSDSTFKTLTGFILDKVFESYQHQDGTIDQYDAYLIEDNTQKIYTIKPTSITRILDVGVKND